MVLTWVSMGLTAERLAQRFGIMREAADEFSLQSHKKALAAIQAGNFEDEIVPVAVGCTVPNGSKPKKQELTFKTDEGPRSDTSLEALLAFIAQRILFGVCPNKSGIFVNFLHPSYIYLMH